MRRVEHLENFRQIVGQIGYEIMFLLKIFAFIFMLVNFFFGLKCNYIVFHEKTSKVRV